MGDHLPLDDTAVLVVRPRDQAADLSERIRALGGEAVEAPTVELLPGDLPALAAAVDELAAGGFVAVALTSRNGVSALAAAVDAARAPLTILDGVLLAAVGEGTAASVRALLGRDPDLVPPVATTAALGDAFPPGGGRVLLPRADLASPTLPERLRAKGYDPVEVVAYVTARPAGLDAAVLERLAAGTIDVVAFTSASTVRNFVALVGGRAWSARVASIGPVTSQACSDHGMTVDAEAAPHDLDGLAAAVVRAAAGRTATRGDSLPM